MPIWAIDLDGLEAKIAIYGGSAHEPKSVPMFKMAADWDISNGASMGEPHSITRATGFIKLLQQKTSEEGSISRIAIFSHASQYGIWFNDNAGANTASGLLRRGVRFNNLLDKANINDIVAGINNGTIKFEQNAMVVFAGCNTGSPFGINSTDHNQKGDAIIPYAEDFTKATHVSSIGASGKLNIITKEGKTLLRSDYGFYRFDYDKENKSVIKTFLGKEVDSSQYGVQENQDTPESNDAPEPDFTNAN